MPLPCKCQVRFIDDKCTKCGAVWENDMPPPPPWTPITDAIRSWLVCLLPRWFCRWLWAAEWISLGRWAPHILGRTFGNVTGKRIR